MFYAGIGSRRAPQWALDTAEQTARKLAQLGWVLRTGHAPGIDQAFERGAGAAAEIYLPWPTFEHTVPIAAGARVFEYPTQEAHQLAAKHHPNWGACSSAARALHARNCHQVRGIDLFTPASFILCWTPDGSRDGHGPNTGGTGQALRLADGRMQVYNLAREDDRDRVLRFLG